MKHTKIFLSHFEIYLGKWVAKFNFMTVNKYSFLSSNCTEKSANNAPIEYKYPTIIYGYLDSWLFCTVKPVVCVRYASLSALLFPPCKRWTERLIGKKSSWIINNLLDILVCSIVEYFYSLFVFWPALRTGLSKYSTARKNTQRYLNVW